MWSVSPMWLSGLNPQRVHQHFSDLGICRYHFPMLVLSSLLLFQASIECTFSGCDGHSSEMIYNRKTILFSPISQRVKYFSLCQKGCKMTFLPKTWTRFQKCSTVTLEFGCWHLSNLWSFGVVSSVSIAHASLLCQWLPASESDCKHPIHEPENISLCTILQKYLYMFSMENISGIRNLKLYYTPVIYMFENKAGDGWNLVWLRRIMCRNASHDFRYTVSYSWANLSGNNLSSITTKYTDSWSVQHFHSHGKSGTKLCFLAWKCIGNI